MPMIPQKHEKNNGDRILEAARAYARRGWPVLPVKPKGKAPLVALVPNGVNDATTDELQIRKWWRTAPNANVGIATGGKIIPLDVDGQAGEEWLEGKERPPTPHARTGGGGLHVYFEAPNFEVTNPVLWNDGNGAEVRVKGRNGYVVAPPSLHESGKEYEWVDYLSPKDVDPAPCPDWLLDMIQEKAQNPTGGPGEAAVDFTLDAKAEPPAEKFAALLANSEKFKPTWERKRGDLKDSSPSGYDMSLAAQAANADWSDQEIANLLIAHRRKHGDDLKADRPDYYARTLAKAREKGERVPPAAELIEKIIQRGERDATFELVLKNGENVTVGTAKQFLSFPNVQAALYEAGVFLPAMNRADWQGVAQQLLDVREVIPTMTRDEETREWLRAYFGVYKDAPVDMSEGSEHRAERLEMVAEGHKLCIIDTDGFCYLHLSGFLRYVTVGIGQRTTAKDLSQRLTRVGMQATRMASTLRGERVQVRLWVGRAEEVLER